MIYRAKVLLKKLTTNKLDTVYVALVLKKLCTTFRLIKKIKTKKILYIHINYNIILNQDTT